MRKKLTFDTVITTCTAATAVVLALVLLFILMATTP